jgi:predicted GNAT superfamily acetyltransferase
MTGLTGFCADGKERGRDLVSPLAEVNGDKVLDCLLLLYCLVSRSSLISIRDIGAEDFREVLRINEDSSPAVSELSAAEVERLAVDASLAWVVVADGAVIGYLIGYVKSDAYGGEEFAWLKQRLPGFVYIDQVALAPAYRRQGIGGRLYSELELWGRRRQYACLTCEVNLVPPNPESMAFHRRQGFVEIGRMHTVDGRHVSLIQKGIG